ncbi:MAG: hypothetical protein JWO12_2525 [Frankiales bacterium]|nr:hypothetical protein [Frankiales bacterium]
MSLALIPSAPWPAPPGAESQPAERMGWYAAVARWAPSKHNTQPWRFVVRETSLELWADPRRMLPETDPHRREMIISCGVALHFVTVAASALGRQVSTAVLPEGSGGLLARLVEVGSRPVTADCRALLDLIPRRRTDRGPLDGDALPPGVPFLLQSEAAAHGASLRLVTAPGDRATLAGLVARADRLLVQRAAVDRELAGWLREPGDARRDGVPTSQTRGPAASYRAEFVQRDFSSSRSTPDHDRDGADHPVVGILCTVGDREPDWLTAGGALGAVLLRAAAHGANSSYLNQPVEETAIRHQMRDRLALTGSAQVVLRIGVGGAVGPTPRRDPAEITFRGSS